MPVASLFKTDLWSLSISLLNLESRLGMKISSVTTEVVNTIKGFLCDAACFSIFKLCQIEFGTQILEHVGL